MFRNKYSHEDIQHFENLFVLELANNHLGKIARGLEIIQQHGSVVRFNNVKAAIKLQFRDIADFIHPEYKGNKDLRYIKKTEDTRLSKNDFGILVDAIKNVGCIPMATPFDEASVDLCIDFDMPIIKIASSDINDWLLIEKIASTRRPVIVSTGGASEKDLDDLVKFFENRKIPLAINHCVSLYPSEDHELYLDQIDFLKNRYPSHVIGLSTHEYHDWHSSMLMSHAKGARTWERHIDINFDGVPVSPYCSLPEQCDHWYKSFHKAREMAGGVSDVRRTISQKEIKYLDALVRGVYARRNLSAGYVFTKDSFEKDFYLAIPLHKGQLSCREILNGLTLTQNIGTDDQLTIHNIDGPYSNNESLKTFILNRGL